LEVALHTRPCRCCSVLCTPYPSTYVHSWLCGTPAAAAAAVSGPRHTSRHHLPFDPFLTAPACMPVAAADVAGAVTSTPPPPTGPPNMTLSSPSPGLAAGCWQLLRGSSPLRPFLLPFLDNTPPLPLQNHSQTRFRTGSPHLPAAAAAPRSCCHPSSSS